MTRWIFVLTLLLGAGTLRAATYEGILHNDRVRHRASLESGGALFWLDFRGSDLYHIAERYDRERVVVSGQVDFPNYESRGVVFVDSITFRPYGRAVTYEVAPPHHRTGERRYYTRYETEVREDR